MTNMNMTSEIKGEPLRVTHVVLSLEFGGMERVVLELVREGLRRGQHVSVVCLEKPGTLGEQVASLGAPVVSLGKPPGLKFEIIDKIRGALVDLKSDVIHTHQIGALLYAGPAAKAAKVTGIVHTEHIDNVSKSKSLMKKWRVRGLWAIAGRHANRFNGVSADIVDAICAYGVVPRRKAAVVSNGIDTDAFLDNSGADDLKRSLEIPLGVPVIGSIARLNEVKRQDLLIGAFAKLLPKFPEAHLLLVGDGPEREALTKLTHDLKVTEKVHFAGYQSRPQDFLHAMDIFALTSRLEGMPLVILEAWAAGLPVVSSNVGGIPDMIDEGKTGLMFPSGDEDALVAILADLLTHRERAEALGKAGREYVRSHFDTKVMASDYENQYREVIAAEKAKA